VCLVVILVATTGCNSAFSDTGQDLRNSVGRLVPILEAYWEIPVRTRSYGSSGVLVWRDNAQLTEVYQKYRADVLSTDTVLAGIAAGKDPWSDDAAFCRGILHWLWAQFEPTRQRREEALVVLNGFTQRRSIHLEESTKAAMKDPFVNKHEAILTPNLSYEENAQVIFQAQMAHLLVQLKEFEKAIEQNELIARRYPTSRYSQQHVAQQIKTIRGIMDGSVTIPETIPE
jgi:hypothetical protein